ncbi:MAG: PKD domain-containing protein [Candidatus Peribacteraceae bacterium]|nr:PKD domain-containing protein [Candidatus Peribacteraceae bacterium]
MNLRQLFSKVWLAFLAAVLICPAVLAADDLKPAAEELQAVISADASAAVDVPVEFSAAYSRNPFPERPAVFSWSFGDGSLENGEIVSHIFEEAGTYEIRLKMQSGFEVAETSFPLLVFEDNILLLTDSAAYEDKITALVGAAREQNTFLDVAWGVENQIGFFADENALTSALQEKFETLRTADLIILWASGGDGLNALASFAQKLNPPLDFSDKEVVVVSDGNLDSLARIARGSFASLEPREILLTRSDALREIVLSESPEALSGTLEVQAIPFRAIDSGLEDFQLTAPLSFFVSYLVASGIPPSVILLVLMLPVIATLVAFLKQVVGVTTFGVYTPSVLTLSFLAIGWKLGIAVLFVVVFASILIRKMLRRYRLAYTPRLAIVLSFVALAIFAAIVLLTWLAPFGSYFRVADLIAASIFPMLIMSTLAEKFVSIQSEKGSRSAVRMFGELLLVSLACYVVVGEWSSFQTLMLAHPEIILLFVVFDVMLAKFTGLRITEYFRFHEVIRKTEEE